MPLPDKKALGMHLISKEFLKFEHLSPVRSQRVDMIFRAHNSVIDTLYHVYELLAGLGNVAQYYNLLAYNMF